MGHYATLNKNEALYIQVSDNLQDTFSFKKSNK